MEWEYKTQAIRILTKPETEDSQLFLDPNLTEDSQTNSNRWASKVGSLCPSYP